VFKHLVKHFVVLSLLDDLSVLEVVESVSHAQTNLVLVFQVAQHQFQAKLLERHRPHHPQLQRNKKESDCFDNQLILKWANEVLHLYRLSQVIILRCECIQFLYSECLKPAARKS
jgi:hypothetical protein